MAKSLRILLIGNYSPDCQASMHRFAAVLARSLSARGHQVIACAPQPRVGALKPGSSGLGKWLGYIDKYILFPRSLLAAVDDVDVVHILDHSNAMYVSAIRHRPHVITCHDLIAVRSANGEFPGYRPGFTGRLQQHWIRRSLEKAQLIAAVSTATAHDVARLTSHPAPNIRLIANGLHHPFRPLLTTESTALLSSIVIPTGPYLMHVGGDAWYKNRIGVVHIFSALAKLRTDLQLVMVGPPLPENLRQIIKAAGCHDRVHVLRCADDEVLNALYNKAEALLFPSLIEGYGWPIAEALSAGCPVFTTNRAPMTEVGGQAARYIDPTHPSAAAELIVKELHQRDELRRLALLESARFATSTMIDGYEALYADLTQ